MFFLNLYMQLSTLKKMIFFSREIQSKFDVFKHIRFIFQNRVFKFVQSKNFVEVNYSIKTIFTVNKKDLVVILNNFVSNSSLVYYNEKRIKFYSKRIVNAISFTAKRWIAVNEDGDCLFFEKDKEVSVYKATLAVGNVVEMKFCKNKFVGLFDNSFMFVLFIDENLNPFSLHVKHLRELAFRLEVNSPANRFLYYTGENIFIHNTTDIYEEECSITISDSNSNTLISCLLVLKYGDIVVAKGKELYLISRDFEKVNNKLYFTHTFINNAVMEKTETVGIFAQVNNDLQIVTVNDKGNLILLQTLKIDGGHSFYKPISMFFYSYDKFYIAFDNIVQEYKLKSKQLAKLKRKITAIEEEETNKRQCTLVRTVNSSVV